MKQALLLMLLAATAAAASALPAPEASTSPPPQPSAVEAAVRRAAAAAAAAPADEDNYITADAASTEAAESNETTPVDNLKRDSMEDMYFERDKERRIMEIKGYIYNLTRPGEPSATLPGPSTVVDSKMLNGLVSKMVPPDVVSGEYPKKFTSFHPICTGSGNKKVEAAKNGDDMFMMFNLTYSSPLDNFELSIISAKLRLYKVSQSNGTDGEEACSNSQKQQAAKSTPATAPTDEAAATSSTTPPPSTTPTTTTTAPPTVFNLYPDAKEVRVTISYLVRQPKRNNKLGRNILDSKMVSMTGDGWVEFNVSKAVRDWRNATNNMGLFVEVEDLERKRLPANKFFKEMNCSKETADTKPIPSVLFDAALAQDNHTTSDHLRPYMLPVISLCTAEIPVTEPGSSFYGRDAADDEFRKFTISYPRLQQQLQRHQHKKASASAAAEEEEQVIDMQVQNTEEHHPRRHRNHRHPHHQHHKQMTLQDAIGQQLRDALLRQHKGRNHEQAAFHISLNGHRRHEDEQLKLYILPVVVETSKVAEMDDEIDESERKPISIDDLFQR